MIETVSVSKERILIIESDAATSDLIGRQTLAPLGYQVDVVGVAASAVQEAVRFAPDVVILNLSLPGLSGKDMLVALSAHGLNMPVLVLAEKGMEADVLQAFRLGASDYLSLPIREAEVVLGVERLMQQVRARKEHESLSKQLHQTNQELQRRVRELTTLFGIGKAVISVTDQRALFDKIVEGGVTLTEADLGWLLLRDDQRKIHSLVAHKNLPAGGTAHLNQPWDDGISSLVALSGEPLTIHGEALRRFKVARYGQAVLVVPLKVRKEVVGLLVMMRQAMLPFAPAHQALLEAVADYASISLMNARLFKALEERAHKLQHSADTAQLNQQIIGETLQKASLELRKPLAAVLSGLDELLVGSTGRLNAEQVSVVRLMRERMSQLSVIADSMAPIRTEPAVQGRLSTNLNEVAQQCVRHFQAASRQNNVSLAAELGPLPVVVSANPVHILEVLEGYLSNAVRHSPSGGRVILRVESLPDNQAHVLVQDQGSGIDAKTLAVIFENPPKADVNQVRRFGGLGIGLPLIREIITAHGGKVWAESKLGGGSTFHFTLPLLSQ
jgi:signal transduction histidine kinase/DNA-binding response OmpR family regulator